MLLLLLFPSSARGDLGQVVSSFRSGEATLRTTLRPGRYGPLRVSRDTTVKARARVENGRLTGRATCDHPARVGWLPLGVDRARVAVGKGEVRAKGGFRLGPLRLPLLPIPASVPHPGKAVATGNNIFRSASGRLKGALTPDRYSFPLAEGRRAPRLVLDVARGTSATMTGTVRPDPRTRELVLDTRLTFGKPVAAGISGLPSFIRAPVKGLRFCLTFHKGGRPPTARVSVDLPLGLSTPVATLPEAPLRRETLAELRRFTPREVSGQLDVLTRAFSVSCSHVRGRPWPDARGRIDIRRADGVLTQGRTSVELRDLSLPVDTAWFK